MEQLEDQVVVVGAGPVGMTAAALLAAYGVSVTILERNASTSNEPKAISLDDESLRIFQSAGLADRILGVIVPGTGTRYYGASGAPMFKARAAVPFRLGYPFKNPFAQPDLERELMAHLADHPLVSVRTNTAVRDLRQSTGDVEVLFDDDGGSGSIRASYVLGCDGGRSTTRSRAGIGMTGRVLRRAVARRRCTGRSSRPAIRHAPRRSRPAARHRSWPGRTMPVRVSPASRRGHAGHRTRLPAGPAAARAVPFHHRGSGRACSHLPVPRAGRRPLEYRPDSPARRRRPHDAALRRPGSELRDPGRRQPVLESRRGSGRPPRTVLARPVTSRNDARTPRRPSGCPSDSAASS